MKKDMIFVTVYLLLAAVLISVFVLYFGELEIENLFAYAGVLIGFIYAINKARISKEGMPVEDELSKKIKLKAGAWSFYSSIFLWGIIGIYDHFHKLETGKIFFYGFTGMTILFGVIWLFLRFKGKFNE